LSGLTAFSNWRQWWPQQAADAITDARERLSAAIARWDLQDLTVLTGGEVAVTLAGRRGAQSVVLKVSPNVAGKTAQLADEAAGLKHWQRTGTAATVLAAADGGLTLLLERLTPGMTLRACALGEQDILTALGDVAWRLHGAGRADAPTFTHLSDSELGADMTLALAGHHEEAAELAELLARSPGDVLLHCDLHSLNVLKDADGYKVIDPKPHLGDRHADIFGLLYGDHVSLPADRDAASALAHARVACFAQAAGMNADRARRWTRLRARSIEQWVLAMDHPTDADRRWAQQMHAIAIALR